MSYEEALDEVQWLIEKRVGRNNDDDPTWETYWTLVNGYEATVECIRELLQYCNHAETAEKAYQLLDKMGGKS